MFCWLAFSRIGHTMFAITREGTWYGSLALRGGAGRGGQKFKVRALGGQCTKGAFS